VATSGYTKTIVIRNQLITPELFHALWRILAAIAIKLAPILILPSLCRQAPAPPRAIGGVVYLKRAQFHRLDITARMSTMADGQIAQAW
jgi:hypothetical protein